MFNWRIGEGMMKEGGMMKDSVVGDAAIGDGTRITLGREESYLINDGTDLTNAFGQVTLIDVNDSRCGADGTDCSAQGEMQVVLKATERSPNGRSQLILLGSKSETCVDSYIGGIELVEAESAHATIRVDESCL
jgi:hypothetical protein